MNPRHAAAAAVLMMTASIVVETQTATSSARLPAFEVATVKWHKSDAPRNFWLDPGGRLTITGFTLRDLIRIAYGSDESKLQTAAQFIGGPSWVATDRFDIAAKAEGDVYPNQADGSRQLLGMLNRLITERFRLVVHTEMREMPIYLLVLAGKDGKLGPGLHPSTVDCAEPKPDQAPAPPDPVRWCGFRGVGTGVLSGQSVTFAQMATIFSGYAEVRRPVFDRTGLSGKFDLHIESIPTLLRSALMRYYRKPPIGIVPVGMLVVFLRYFLQSRSFATSFLQSIAGGTSLAVVAYAFHRCWYWEVGDTALIHRRLFRRITFPFSEITYVGPMTGDGSGYTFFENTILVRTGDGKRMFIDTAKPGALLADMRKRAPRITLNL